MGEMLDDDYDDWQDPRRNQFACWIDEPRVWEDTAGNAHFNVPELLRMVDMPDTPENRRVVISIATEALEKVGASFVVRHGATD